MTTIPPVHTINPETFLPSCRSVAFKKTAWQTVGGFDERYSHNEDTPFMIALRKRGMRFLFQPKAIVYWQQRNSLPGLWQQMSRYGYGDAEAWSLASHYAFFVLLGGLSFAMLTLGLVHSPWWFLIWCVLAVGYLYLPLILQTDREKRFSYLYLLPLTRVTIITAMLVGFARGLLHRLLKV